MLTFQTRELNNKSESNIHEKPQSPIPNKLNVKI